MNKKSFLTWINYIPEDKFITELMHLIQRKRNTFLPWLCFLNEFLSERCSSLVFPSNLTTKEDYLTNVPVNFTQCSLQSGDSICITKFSHIQYVTVDLSWLVLKESAVWCPVLVLLLYKHASSILNIGLKSI